MMEIGLEPSKILGSLKDMMRRHFNYQFFRRTRVVHEEDGSNAFGESFGKFGDFGSYPQGTAGPSNAKAAGSSGVKISEVEEEEEEHVEAAEKVQEESKLAEVEEIEKNDEKKNQQKRHQKQNKNLPRDIRESSSSHTTSNSSSDNGKSEGRNGSRQEKEKEEQSQDPNIVPTASQPVPESTISLPMQYGPRRTKTQARKSVLPIPPKIQVPIPEKEPQRRRNKPNLLIPLTLGEVAEFLATKKNLEIF
ncbi:hypothetical protein GH714_033834 [Hevea brasiliensis]|uniref:Uncharacterized protein n=1 Tax=Hevea brasiliensis TaxID=3981 RepID=A0A6A6N6Y6_HEVBR|nr:hypothetical protein GH714_033834 [Hevea brasiliensis]